jgi:septum formation protein
MNQELIVLASASPRRRQLLDQIGVAFQVQPVAVDESRFDEEAPADFVRRIALAKATDAWRVADGAAGRLVIGADTTVSLGETVLGKPRDEEEARAMLRTLSGQTHDVTTAVAAVQEAERAVRVSSSKVTFRALTAAEIAAYVLTGEPLDKAGAYGIQGLAAVFVERLEGSYSGVMGLPLFETAGLLRDFGLDVLSAGGSRIPG